MCAVEQSDYLRYLCKAERVVYITSECNVNQNNGHRYSENPHALQVFLRDLEKNGVWCAVCARNIIGLVVFKETNYCDYIFFSLTPSSGELTE